MGELLMTVLLVSILWMILDLLKVFFQEHREGPGNEAVRDPGRQKLTQYAEAFEGLSETFLKLPKLKEDLEKEDREEILKETSHQVCRDCEAMEWCWSEHREDTLREAYERLFSMEKGEEELPRLSFCIRSDRFLAELRLKYQLARQNLLWTNRLFGVREMWKVERPDGCRELYVTMRALGKKRCVGMREAAACLSSACGERMIPARDSRMVINQDYSTVMFMPAPEYMMLCGAARVTRDGEVVSGDSFAVYHRDSGEMILSISDGMGSGPEAGQESSQTVELMEQFLNAGFDRETSIKMLHSVMLLRDSSCFSTMDLAAVNLYTGECELLKVGAAATFLKRGDWVETVSSTSMPMGLIGEADYECTKKQLRPGDFLVMVSDGILDAFPGNHGEDKVQELILNETTDNAAEMAKNILEEVLKFRRRKAEDDMTVLVGGLWRR